MIKYTLTKQNLNFFRNIKNISTKQLSSQIYHKTIPRNMSSISNLYSASFSKRDSINSSNYINLQSLNTLNTKFDVLKSSKFKMLNNTNIYGVFIKI